MNVEPRWKNPERLSKRRSQVKYAKARAEVIERSQGRCEAAVSSVCRGRGDQAHHVRRRSQGGSDDPSNLKWVCDACHGHIHAHPAEAESVGLLKRSSFDPAPGLVRVEKVTR